MAKRLCGLFLAPILWASSALAQSQGGSSSGGISTGGTTSGGSSAVTLPNPIGGSSLIDVVNKVTGFMFTIAIPLVAIMALVGGFQMMTAAGNPEKFASGRKTLMYAAIGFAVVLLAGGVVNIIKNLLGS